MTAPLSGKMLVADDDDAFRSMLAEYLARHGCEVLQATNGLEALLHVKHESSRAAGADAVARGAAGGGGGAGDLTDVDLDFLLRGRRRDLGGDPRGVRAAVGTWMRGS